MGQFDDVDQANVALPALDTADVVAMEVGELSQSFLGEAALFAQPPHSPAKENPGVMDGHTAIFKIRTLCVHTL